MWDDFVEEELKEENEVCLDKGVQINLDRLRRMAGRGERPYTKWKKLAATTRADASNR